MIDLTKLREQALDLSPEVLWPAGVADSLNCVGRFMAGQKDVQIALFVGTLSPSAVLALLDRLQEAERISEMFDHQYRTWLHYGSLPAHEAYQAYREKYGVTP